MGSKSSSDSPLGVEDAVEGGSSPILPGEREDRPQVVEGNMALWEGALQPGFLEGGPLLLQGSGATQIPLREETSDGNGKALKIGFCGCRVSFCISAKNKKQKLI